MSNTKIHRSTWQLTSLYFTLAAALLATGAWLRGEQVMDDRGSDSSEKSLMIILAISIGATVSAAAAVYIASKTALFK